MAIKSIGMVRDVDGLGRVVLPKELRKTMDIHQKDPLEIYVEDDAIILKKYEPGCTFCGSISNIVSFKEKRVCKECLTELIELSNDSAE